MVGNSRCQPSISEPSPYTYGYMYPDQCVRFNGGVEVNGSRPLQAIPLYDAKAIASLRARVEELEKALKTGAIELERITKWLERLSVVAERQAKDTRFQTLADANAADARNYRNTIKSIEPALTAARAALNTGEGE